MQASETSGQVFILLKDKEQAEKTTRVLGVPLPRQLHISPCRVLKGELVTPIPPGERVQRNDGQSPHNYRTVTKDSPATFYHDDTNEIDLSPLSQTDYDVLASVKSTFDRFHVFIEGGKLDWVTKLKKGDKVLVELPVQGGASRAGRPRASAVIRYVGPVITLPGVTFGVEIKDKNYLGWGTTNGVFQEEQYFSCKEDCGLFVSVEKIFPVEGGQKQPPQHHRGRESPRMESSVDTHSGYRYKIGDRVVVFTKKGDGVHGTVKWVGMYSYTLSRKDCSVKSVGVETDVRLKATEVDGLPIKSHYFVPAKEKGAVFLTEGEVLSEADFAEGRAPVQEHSVSTQEKQLLQEAIYNDPDHVRGQSAALAKEPGITTELIRQDTEARRKLAQGKQKEEERRKQQELEEVKQAVPDQSLNVSGQERLLRQFSEERRRVGGQIGGGGGGNEGERRETWEGNGRREERGGEKESWNGLQRKGHTYEDVDRRSQGGSPRNQHHATPQPGATDPWQGGNLPQDGSHRGLPAGNPQPLAHSQGHYPPAPQSSGPQGHYPPAPQSSGPQGHYPPAPQASGPQGHYPPASQASGPQGHYPPAPQSSGPQGHYPPVPQSSGPQGHYPPAHQSSGPQGHHPPAHQSSGPQGHTAHADQQPATGGVRPPTDSQYPGQHKAYAGHPSQTLPPLDVGSPVELVGDPSRHGVIRWLGPLPEARGLIAGVELDGPMDGCGDGERGGHRYFTCLTGRGFFCPVFYLRPDPRLPQATPPAPHGGSSVVHLNPLAAVPNWEELDQTIKGDQISKYIGNRKGIQGHQNSCYLDATIFGLFALSDVFDSLFLDHSEKGLLSLQPPAPATPATKVQEEIGAMLWKGIVNPLRKHGVVRFESVMKLRNKLEELGKMEGVNTAEKDPEEFLNMLFKHTLHVDPFIHIKRPFGTEPEFFVQLFVEFDQSIRVPTIENLLMKMFREQQISFSEVPSKLLVQVPRYGKQFKTYKRIIPGIKFDTTPLLDSQNTCFLCGDPAQMSCPECSGGEEFKPANIYFCNSCSSKVHKHPARVNHKPEWCAVVEGEVELSLLSVLCIETSHYVCFSRDSEGRWLFFDSMADRIYDQFNIPRGVDCTAQLNQWVYEGDQERLMAAGPRELPELVRRFTQDVYMCVYIQPDYGMYG